MGWEHYQTVDPLEKEPQVCRGLFGVRLLILHFKFDFPNPSNLHHFIFSSIDHFTVVGLVTWPLNGSEAGVDHVLIKTSLLLLCKSSCSYAN